MKKPSENTLIATTAILFVVFTIAAVITGSIARDLNKSGNKTDQTKAGMLENSSYVLWALTALDTIAFIIFERCSAKQSQQISNANNLYGTLNSRIINRGPASDSTESFTIA
jgi:preprotein translocase subunit SecG